MTNPTQAQRDLAEKLVKAIKSDDGEFSIEVDIDMTAKTIAHHVAEEVAKANEWQPIETAPRDGTLILGYSLDDHDDFYPDDYFICMWCDFHPASESGKKYLIGEGRKGKFEYFCWLKRHNTCMEAKPTHWKLLPQPPAESETNVAPKEGGE